MKHAIYVMRHQRPEYHAGNCVATKEIQRTRSLCERIRALDVRKVIACAPGESKHIRPLQTASNLCSWLNGFLEVCEDVNALPNFIGEDTLIVWHHSDMGAILNRYGFVGRFDWPYENYDGCLIITKHGWEYQPSFFSETKSASCFGGWW